MPQMAPISWLMLFITFFIILIMFNTLNYFNYIPSINKNLTHKENKNFSMNWKW